MNRWPRVSMIGTGMMMVSVFSACVPSPHYVIISPALTGKVHRGGKPVENAVVSIEHPRGDTCSFKSDVATRTNRDGIFHFAAQKEFSPFANGGSSRHFQICIIEGSARHQGWYEHRLGGMDERLVLDCEVQNPLPIYKDTLTGRIMGICRASAKQN